MPTFCILGFLGVFAPGCAHITSTRASTKSPIALHLRVNSASIVDGAVVPELSLTFTNTGEIPESYRAPVDFLHGELVFRAGAELIVILDKRSLDALISGMFVPQEQVLRAHEARSYRLRLLEEFVPRYWTIRDASSAPAELTAGDKMRAQLVALTRADEYEGYFVTFDRRFVSNVVIVAPRKVPRHVK